MVDHTECHYVGTDIGPYHYYMRQFIKRNSNDNIVNWYAVIQGHTYVTKSLKQVDISELEPELEQEFQDSNINATLE